MAVRMNISISEDLRRRMEPLDENRNWSAVAAAAFERDIELFERDTERADTIDAPDETVQRLLDTEVADLERIADQGFRAGAVWAKYRARMRHLRILEKLQLSGEESPDDIAQALYGRGETWVDNIGEDCPNEVDVEDGWLTSFVEGAVSVLDDVREKALHRDQKKLSAPPAQDDPG